MSIGRVLKAGEMFNGTVFGRWGKCPSCGRGASYNVVTEQCSVISCSLYPHYEVARHTHGGIDPEQVEGGDFAA